MNASPSSEPSSDRHRGVTRQQVQAQQASAHRQWFDAVRAHQLAPPDAGFSARLTKLAAAAEEQASAYLLTERFGGRTRPVPGARAAVQPPPELRPDSGRRGPGDLWARFDAGVLALGEALEDGSNVRIARAYEDLSAVLAQLAEAAELPQPRKTSRRAAS
jgi:hypothetical protein